MLASEVLDDTSTVRSAESEAELFFRPMKIQEALTKDGTRAFSGAWFMVGLALVLSPVLGPFIERLTDCSAGGHSEPIQLCPLNSLTIHPFLICLSQS